MTRFQSTLCLGIRDAKPPGKKRGSSGFELRLQVSAEASNRGFVDRPHEERQNRCFGLGIKLTLEAVELMRMDEDQRENYQNKDAIP